MTASIKPTVGKLTEENLKYVVPIEAQPGNADDPEGFVGRSDIDKTALKYLSTGKNLLLSDPRRM